jgi:hypothetical protein
MQRTLGILTCIERTNLSITMKITKNNLDQVRLY